MVPEICEWLLQHQLRAPIHLCHRITIAPGTLIPRVKASAVVVGIQRIRDSAERQPVDSALCIAVYKPVQHLVRPRRGQPHELLIYVLVGLFLELSLIDLLHNIEGRVLLVGIDAQRVIVKVQADALLPGLLQQLCQLLCAADVGICLVLRDRQIVEPALLPALVYAEQLCDSLFLQIAVDFPDVIHRRHDYGAGSDNPCLPLRSEEVNPRPVIILQRLQRSVFQKIIPVGVCHAAVICIRAA